MDTPSGLRLLGWIGLLVGTGVIAMTTGRRWDWLLKYQGILRPKRRRSSPPISPEQERGAALMFRITAGQLIFVSVILLYWSR